MKRVYKFFKYLFGKRKFKKRILEIYKSFDKYYPKLDPWDELSYRDIEIEITKDLYFFCTPSISVNRMFDGLGEGFCPRIFFSKEDTHNGIYRKLLIPWEKAYKKMIDEDLLDVFESKINFELLKYI